MPAIGAGQLRERLRFEQRGPDANGDPLGPWDADGGLVRSARVWCRLGTEAVLEKRLQGLQPAEISIRADPATRAIGNAWRAVDLFDTSPTPRVFAIVSVAPSEDAAWITLLATVGGPDA